MQDCIIIHTLSFTRGDKEYAMSYSRVRFPLLMGAMLAAALPAYSQQSTSSAPPANTPPPAAASEATTTATAAAAPAQTSTPAAAQTSTPAAAQTTASNSAPAKPSQETVKKAKSLGLHAEVRNGATVYCWKDSNIGTRIPTEKCAGEDQLDDLIRQRQAVQDEMRGITPNK
jgi:hypothetical protein